MEHLQGSKPDDESEDSPRELGIGPFSDVSLFVDGELDNEACENYLNKACQAFRNSELATKKDGCGWDVYHFLSLGLTYFGTPAETMTREYAEELLLELYPRKVSQSSENCDSVIDELVAFWNFCDQVHHFENAAMLAELIASWRRPFREAMSDSGNFGLAKSLFSAGTAAGYDMSNEQDLAAFVMQLNMAQMAARDQLRFDDPDDAPPESLIPKDLKQRKKLLKKLKRR